MPLVKSFSPLAPYGIRLKWAICTICYLAKKDNKKSSKKFKKPLDKSPAPWYNMQAL